MVTKRAKPGPRTQERRQSLTVAAYRAMLRSGLDVRTRDVAAEAGITVATLHYYFPTKEDLVRVVLEYAIQERIILPIDGDGTAHEGPELLRTMLVALREQAEDEPGHFRLLHEMIWASHTDPALNSLLSGWHDDWHTGIVRCLENGQREGSVRADLDTPTTAAMIMYMIIGIVLRPPMSDEPRERLAAELDRLLASTAPSDG
jgi:TetR/AcrR family transcriptional regulator, regulator of cefoperazone and chloramphenicol sensitivity